MISHLLSSSLLIGYESGHLSIVQFSPTIKVIDKGYKCVDDHEEQPCVVLCSETIHKTSDEAIIVIGFYTKFLFVIKVSGLENGKAKIKKIGEIKLGEGKPGV